MKSAEEEEGDNDAKAHPLPEGGPSASPVDPERPWLGLHSFGEEHGDYFFGRRKESRELLDLILHWHLSVVYGKSGLGKTSLLRAGVLPRLRERGFVPVIFRLRFGEEDPPLSTQVNREIADALSPSFPGRDLFALFEKQGLWAAFHDPEAGLLGEGGHPGTGAPPLVLLFDQFEEIFTLGQEKAARREESDTFLADLSCLVENRPPPSLSDRLEEDDALAERLDFSARPVRTVLCLRDDFLHRLERHRAGMPSMMDSRFELRPLRGPQAYLAAYEPGTKRHPQDSGTPGGPSVTAPILSPETARGVVRFVAGTGPDTPLEEIENVPPLLSLICEQLNARRLREKKDQIGVEFLEKSAQEILKDFYESSFAGHPPAVRKLVEGPLVSASGFRETMTVDSAAAQLRAGGVPDPESVLAQLVDQRLLVLEERGGVRRIELTHDILARLATGSRGEAASRFEEAASRWTAAGRSRAHLLTGADLEEAQELVGIRGNSLNEETRELVTASVEARLQAESRTKKLRLLVTASLVLLTFAALGTATVAFLAKNDAVHQKEVANKETMAATAARLDAETAREEARKNLAQSQLNEGRAWLEKSKSVASTEQNYFEAAVSAGRAIGYRGFGGEKAGERSPGFGSENLILIPEDSEPGLFEQARIAADTNAHVAYLPVWRSPSSAHHSGYVTSVAFSPDGVSLASGSWDKTVRLWDAATGGLKATLEGHSDYVWSVAFSPDGSALASGSEDGTVRLWDAATGELKATLEGHSDSVSSVAFSPDGSALASGSEDGTVRLWDAATGGPKATTLEGHSVPVWSVAFSPDGASLASGSDDNTVRIWDAATGGLKATLEGHSGSVISVAFSPDGASLASGAGDKTVRLWDAATGGPKATLEGHSGPVYRVAFSPDGASLASGSEDHTVRIWDAATGGPKATLEGHSGSVISVAYSPDGATLASGSEDGAVRLWDAATGEPKATLGKHSSDVTSVAFSPDGAVLASGSYDHTVRLWDAATGGPKATLEGHSGSVTSVAFSPDGASLASGSEDGTVRLWDAATGGPKATLEGHSSGVTGVAFSPDGSTLASGSSDGTVRLWDAATGGPKATLEGYFKPVTSVTFSPDGATLASGYGDGTVRIWDAATGEIEATLEGHYDGVTSVAFSPDGASLASGSEDGTVRLWDAATGGPKATLEGHSSRVTSVAYSPDGASLASGSEDGTVRLWDAATGGPKATLEGHSSRVTSVAYSPDGSSLASGSSDKTVRLWDATGGLKATLEGHSGHVISVAFSPDGAFLASGSEDGTVRIWDAPTGGLKATLEGHSGRVISVAFSPDGKTLASGSEDGTVRLWDAATGGPKATLGGHSDTVFSVAFSPDGASLASGSYDHTVRIWDAATGGPKGTLEGHSSYVTSVAFSPDGETLASGSYDHTVRLWDAATGGFKATLEGHSDGVWSVAFSADGASLASGSDDNTIRLWDAATGGPKATLEGHSDEVWSVAYSPDGATLASGSSDGAVQLWDAATGEPKATLGGHSSAVTSVAFSPDSAVLASGSWDFTVRLWDITPKRDIDLAAYFTRGEFRLSFEGCRALPPSPNLLEADSYPPINRTTHALIMARGAGDPERIPHLLASRNLPQAVSEYRRFGENWTLSQRVRTIQGLLLITASDWAKGAPRANVTIPQLAELVTHELAATGELDLALVRLASAAGEIPSADMAERHWPAVLALIRLPGKPHLLLSAGGGILAKVPASKPEAELNNFEFWGKTAADDLKSLLDNWRRSAAGDLIAAALEIAPDDIQVLRAFAGSMEDKDTRKLPLLLQLTDRSDATSEDFADAGYLAAQLGKREEALDIFARGREKFSKDEEVHRLAGWGFFSLDAPEEALAAFEAAASLSEDPDSDSELQFGLAIAYWINGKKEEAVESYKKLIGIGRAQKEPVDLAKPEIIAALTWPDAKKRPLEEVRAATLEKYPELANPQ